LSSVPGIVNGVLCIASHHVVALEITMALAVTVALSKC